MVNTIREGDRSLVRVDYSSLLKAILERLQTTNLWRISSNGKQLFIDVDEIAYSLATQGGIEMPLGSNWRGAKVATTHLTESSKDSFVSCNREIRACLEKCLDSWLQERNYQFREDFVRELWTALNQFQGKVGNQISLSYDFNKDYPGLSKQRLTLKHEDEDYPFLKFHRLTISIENTPGQFDLRLKESLKAHIASDFNGSSSKDEAEELLEELYGDRNKPDSDWYRLKRLMDEEAIPKVQRAAKIKYLEYLWEHIGENANAIYLEVLIRRLQALERYINDVDKSDGDYEVSYGGISCNLKVVFSRAEAFDSLPIIPQIDGNLGEIRDENKDELNFVFGLKLKLAGKVQSEDGKTVLDYNLGLIDPESKQHKAGLEYEDGKRKEGFVKKIIRLVVLYFFVFAGNDPKKQGYDLESDLEYEVIDKFAANILPVLKDSDENKKHSLFKGIVKGVREYGAETKIYKLRDLLQQTKSKASKLRSSRVYPIQINVKQGVLETDIEKIDEGSTLFCNGLRENKTALKYISVGEASIDTSSLCYLSGNIKIDEIGYFETTDNQEFSLEYAAGNFPAIPVVLYPQVEKCRKILEKSFQDKKLILFPYQNERLKQDVFQDSQANEAFIYRFVFLLLSYISLKILLDTATEKLNKKLFLPIIRLHLGDKQHPLKAEVFLRDNFAILAHLFNVNHRANTQGFRVKDVKAYKMKNGLSSLYNVLPKKFKFTNPPINPKLNKLAIVVVSSRECDRTWRGESQKSNLTGEIIKIDRKEDGSILVYTSKTISEHYNTNRLYRNPDTLVAEVETLYKNGYQHILYIAKSPYSQTLNLTATEKDNFYFMSPEVIRNLKGEQEDLKIYPVFFDKYYVVSLKETLRKSFYIQDAEELTDVVNDPTKQIAVFFNLFNGIKVGGREKYYNGVISYSTLLNVYEQNLLDTSDIYAGLIDNDADRSLKNEILQLLTLFHFSRYEAANKDIQLKLDPYTNIIGDKSVGALSIFPHAEATVEFNGLAFLNEVNDALDAKL
ncbi:MAG: hypothetical protein WBG70_17305 [Spirulinaceae cyanobacterium]